MTTDMRGLKAVRFTTGNEEARIGVLTDNDQTIRDAGAAGPIGFVPTAEAWAKLAEVAKADQPTTYSVQEVKILHPVTPSKILAIGVNYRSHADESDLAVPDVPVIFAKYPSSLIGHGANIVIPREETRPDFEGEVAVVIGERLYRATPEQARAGIGAITAFHDVSGRRAQLETPLRQFTLGKSFDTFAPMGPWLLCSDGVDLEDIHVRTTVSGEVMQDASTKDLIHSIVDLIVYCTKGLTLEPGDVIATGTPGGVGDSRIPPRYLREGDVVEVYVDGVGTLRNPVVMEK